MAGRASASASHDLLELLVEDHDRLREAAATAATARAPEEREEAVAVLHNEFMLHTGPEEEVIYATLAEKEDGSGAATEIVDWARGDHRGMRDLLGYLATLDPATSRWDGALEELGATLEEHLEREEAELFEALRDIADAAEYQQMADDFVAAKRKLWQERQTAA